jgi:hypothetical protein
MNQREVILKHLRDYGSISPLEARHVYGIERLASRIEELKRDDVPVVTHMKKDAKGKRYAEYRFAPVYQQQETK